MGCYVLFWYELSGFSRKIDMGQLMMDVPICSNAESWGTQLKITPSIQYFSIRPRSSPALQDEWVPVVSVLPPASRQAAVGPVAPVAPVAYVQPIYYIII